VVPFLIEDAFLHFDSDENGLIDWSDVNAGLRCMALGKDKPNLTIKDFDGLSRGGVLCSLQGQLSLSSLISSVTS
jgi:hypothetical protein